MNKKKEKLVIYFSGNKFEFEDTKKNKELIKAIGQDRKELIKAIDQDRVESRSQCNTHITDMEEELARAKNETRYLKNFLTELIRETNIDRRKESIELFKNYQ